jgi:hypothetical protein
MTWEVCGDAWANAPDKQRLRPKIVARCEWNGFGIVRLLDNEKLILMGKS